MGFARQIQNNWYGIKDLLLTKGVMLQIARAQGALVVEFTRKRMEAGIDISGKRFGPYSPKYAAKRKRLGLQIDPVNLRAKRNRLQKSVRHRGHKVRQEGAAATLEFIVDVKPGQQRWEEGIRTGKLGKAKRPPRDFLGLSKPGTAAGQRERRQLLRVAKEGLKLNARAKGYVIQNDLR